MEVFSVHPPSFKSQLISFYLANISVNICPLSSTGDKEIGTTWLQWEEENSTLSDGWYDSYVFPQGWIIKMLVAGETLNIFLLTGIANGNIFFMKQKKNEVVYKNIHDKFVSTNPKCKLKNEGKNQTKTSLTFSTPGSKKSE